MAFPMPAFTSSEVSAEATTCAKMGTRLGTKGSICKIHRRRSAKSHTIQLYSYRLERQRNAILRGQVKEGESVPQGEMRKSNYTHNHTQRLLLQNPLSEVTSQ